MCGRQELTLHKLLDLYTASLHHGTPACLLSISSCPLASVNSVIAAAVVLGQQRAHGVSWHRRAEGTSELCKSTMSWSRGQTGILLQM